MIHPEFDFADRMKRARHAMLRSGVDVLLVSVGSDLPYNQDPVCTQAPERIGDYVRSECGAGILPVDHKTTFGATRITYTRGACSVDVLLRIAKVGGITDHGTPQVFQATNLGAGRAESFTNGEVRISERNGRTLAACDGYGRAGFRLFLGNLVQPEIIGPA